VNGGKWLSTPEGAGAPYIGSNGNWFEFDLESESFVDSGVSAYGKQGERGEKGEAGKNLTVIDFYSSLDELEAAVPSPEIGDAYGIGLEAPYDIYIYGKTSGWVNYGPLTAVEDAEPEKNEIKSIVDESETSARFVTALEASGDGSFAEGVGTIARNIAAHAEGFGTTASGEYSHAEGESCIASGKRSHTEGNTTTASGINAHAEGNATVASGNRSHVEGNESAAEGDDSHAEGIMTAASGVASHAEGYNTRAASQYQHVQGRYNVVDGQNVYAHIVGNGTTTSGGSGSGSSGGAANRSNAHTLDWSGNAWFSGNVFVGSNSGANRDGGSKRLGTVPSCVRVTLAADAWDASTKNQTVGVAGVSAIETAQLIQPMPAMASMAAYNKAGIMCTAQGANSLTFTAASVPAESISVYVVITEVGA